MATHIEQPQGTEAPSYEQDFYLWCHRMAEVIRAGRLDEIDRENVAEEIESLAISKLTGLKTRTVVLLMHMLKRDYQPHKRSPSWDNTIRHQRLRIEISIEKIPSLRRLLPTLIHDYYERAVAEAMAQ